MATNETDTLSPMEEITNSSIVSDPKSRSVHRSQQQVQNYTGETIRIVTILRARSSSPPTDQDVKFLTLQGRALFLLERLQESRESYLKGLDISPTDATLQKYLAEVDDLFTRSNKHKKDNNNNDTKTERQLQPNSTEDFDCLLCMRLLYEPITTPCGHTFCRECLARSLDLSNRCPMCRALVFINIASHAPTHVLQSLIARLCPEHIRTSLSFNDEKMSRNRSSFRDGRVR
eukprot:TRINITY_DN1588_c0_g1_i1.p1 TRINITY_DN1588_c0_g1~~TRINITY_DN1588_c0_g1_i1.p1  ORF type:complete len:232 (-),score=41.86 TRINITY_DN1588_c0_g1_i1:417-1112(-)